MVRLILLNIKLFQKVSRIRFRDAFQENRFSQRIHRLIERLKTDHFASAMDELVQAGTAAIPPLLEALERRDVDMRRQAFTVLQSVLEGSASFDPYAPESQRRQQIADLREQFRRKAG